MFRVVVLGVHGSGTTWVFNILRHYMCAHDIPPISGWIKSVPPLSCLGGTNWCFKTHGFYGLKDWSSIQQVKTIQVIRDKRDCIKSVQRRTGLSVSRARQMVENDLRLIKYFSNTNIPYISYERDEISSYKAVCRIFDELDISVCEQEKKLLDNLYSRESVKQFTKGIKVGTEGVIKDKDGLIYEINTLFQPNHIS